MYIHTRAQLHYVQNGTSIIILKLFIKLEYVRCILHHLVLFSFLFGAVTATYLHW